MTYRENHHPLTVCLLIFGTSYQFERHFFLFLFSSLLEGVERCCRGTVGKLIFKCAHIYICKCFNLALFPLGKKKHKCRHKSKGKNELQDIPLSCQLWCAWIGCSQSKKNSAFRRLLDKQARNCLVLTVSFCFFCLPPSLYACSSVCSCKVCFCACSQFRTRNYGSFLFSFPEGGRAVGVIFL